MAYRFTASSVAAEVDIDGEMQAGVAEEDEGFFLLFTSAVGEPSAQDISPWARHVLRDDARPVHGLWLCP
ncbi:hypothetical protein [Streptomyces atroolivaceus]|uniref:hypothetical protein n=1 Tax=Streptomyces atroolivaceus TaxID=66869 RepID=UPI001FCC7DB9|nr:hypothetical protein [Streptomyces atroolivaceus]